MGDLPPAHKQRMAELAAQRQELEGQGKSARDIDELLRNLYDAQTSGKNMHEVSLKSVFVVLLFFILGRCCSRLF